MIIHQNEVFWVYLQTNTTMLPLNGISLLPKGQIVFGHLLMLLHRATFTLQILRPGINDRFRRSIEKPYGCIHFVVRTDTGIDTL